MADEKNMTGRQDRARVSLSDDYEVRDWAKKFGVTAEQIQDAVKVVGNDAKKVEQHLQTNG